MFGVRALEEERLRLVARCDELRSEIALGVRPFTSKAALADRLLSAARGLARSLGPLLLVYSFLKRR